MFLCFLFVWIWAFLTAPCLAVTTTSPATTSPTPRPFRRNILDLQNDGPSWSLYIQALAAMQTDSESNLISYFQISGIHGRPYTSWNGVPQGPGCYATGYCPHGSILFLTWHRPFLALFEQTLLSHAQAIAEQYPSSTQSTYITAASQLRLPYWDWAAQTPYASIPDIISESKVLITTPSGLQWVENPCYTYTFQTFPLNPEYFPTSDEYDGYLAEDPQTVRDPGANNSLSNASLMQDTYTALTKATKYDVFCTTAEPGPSIEDVHNQVHTLVGGNVGHMTQISYSAFDPIFWLHHVNVDRLFAIYLAMHPWPNITLTPVQEGYGTFVLPPYSLSTNTTPLEPFSNNGAWYTSVSSWSTSPFGYTYPELIDWTQSPPDLQKNVTSIINKLYKPNGQFSRKSLVTRDVTTEWSVGIKASKFDLGGQRYVVRVFVGAEPSGDPKDWDKSSSLMGSFSVIPPHVSKGAGFPDVVAYSEIGLTRGLKANGVDSGDLEGVVGYLEGNLCWKVQKLDGTPVPAEQLPGLVLTVQSEVVTLPSDVTELPVYGEKTLHAEVTKGKAGGWDGSAV